VSESIKTITLAELRNTATNSFPGDDVIKLMFDVFMFEHMPSIPIVLLDGWDDDSRWKPVVPEVARLGELLVDELDDKKTGGNGEIPPNKQTVFIIIQTEDDKPYTELPVRTFPDGYTNYKDLGDIPFYFDQDEAEEVVDRINRRAVKKADRRWMYNHAILPGCEVTDEMLHKAGISVSLYTTKDGRSVRLAGINGAGYSFDESHYYPLFVLWLNRYRFEPSPLATKNGPVYLKP
jgi:hypothetical protein